MRKAIIAAILSLPLCFPVSAQAQDASTPGSGMRYEIVAPALGPFLFRLDRQTGDVCAIRIFDMDFAYKMPVKECDDVRGSYYHHRKD